MFENPRKSLIQHCERSELHFEWKKVSKKCPKLSILAIFENVRSLLIEQKMNVFGILNELLYTQNVARFARNVE